MSSFPCVTCIDTQYAISLIHLFPPDYQLVKHTRLSWNTRTSQLHEYFDYFILIRLMQFTPSLSVSTSHQIIIYNQVNATELSGFRIGNVKL